MVKRVGVGAILSVMAVALSLPPASAASEGFDCVRAASQQVTGVSIEIIEDACRQLAAKTAAKEDTEIPTAFMAWGTVGIINNSGNIGYPVGAVCVYEATPSGVDPDLQPRALHAVAGSAQAVGHALSTTINCSVSPVGLSATGTFIGPVAAAANAKFGGFRSQTVCVSASARFIDGSRTDAPESCSPAL